MFDVSRMTAASSLPQPRHVSVNRLKGREGNTLRSTPALPSASFSVATSAVSTPLVAVAAVVVVAMTCRCCVCAVLIAEAYW